MSKIALCFGGTFLMVVCNASSAQAVKMTYSGSDCSLTAYAPGNSSSSPLVYSFAIANSKATGDPPATFCPIINLETSPTTVSATVWDTNATENISCTLSTYGEFGNTIYSAERHTPGSNSVNPYVLYWNQIGVGGAYAMLSCTFPVGTSVVYYDATY